MERKWLRHTQIWRKPLWPFGTQVADATREKRPKDDVATTLPSVATPQSSFGQLAFDWLNESSTESSCGVARVEKTNIPNAGVVARPLAAASQLGLSPSGFPTPSARRIPPIRSKLCVRRKPTAFKKPKEVFL